MKHKFNIQQSINSILYILQELNGVSDFHKIFKILYFADQKHLLSYGRTLTGDSYIAMKNGPVPSKIYDIVKSLRPGELHTWQNLDAYKSLFEVKNNHFLYALKRPDLDEISESAIDSLQESIKENRNLNFQELTKKSHKEAWDQAQGDESVMNILDIAKEASASEEMLQYIQQILDNEYVG